MGIYFIIPTPLELLARGKNKSKTISATTNIIRGCNKLSETAADYRRLNTAVYIEAYAAAHRTSKPIRRSSQLSMYSVSTRQLDISLPDHIFYL